MQLDLLTWERPCRVIAFPTRHRIGKVRQVADALLRKHGREADAYWRRIVSTMAGQMTTAGVPKPEIERELRDFFSAVQSEIERRACRDQTPPGAA